MGIEGGIEGGPMEVTQFTSAPERVIRSSEHEIPETLQSTSSAERMFIALQNVDVSIQDGEHVYVEFEVQELGKNYSFIQKESGTRAELVKRLRPVKNIGRWQILKGE